MAPWPGPWFFNLIQRHSKDSQLYDTIQALPDTTRRFVSPLRVPPDPSRNVTPVVYLLAAESLSERSATDAEELIRAAKPGAVIAQVAPGSLLNLGSEEDKNPEKVPTNLLGVVSACFRDTSQGSKFEIRAGIEVLKLIFGTTYNGHVLSARKAAKDGNSPFLYLETPEPQEVKQSPSRHEKVAKPRSGMFLPGFAQLGLVSQTGGGPQASASSSKDCPAYALPFYSLLVELQGAFHHLPGMNRALEQAQRLLYDVEQGRPVEENQLAEVQSFRLAVEGLRIALNSSAGKVMEAREQQRHVVTRRKESAAPKFENLTGEEQGYVLLAQAIQDQACTHGSVVAVMDASSVAGILRHWDTLVSPEVLERARRCFVFSEFTENELKETGLDRKFAGTSGAVAVVGIASLPWWMPATPLTKVLLIKLPTFLKVGLVQVKRNASVVMAKSMAPFLTPGKSISAAVKAAATAGKSRAAAHGVVASVERATFSAMRTAFYSLMRKKQGMSSGGRPWLLLGCSIAAGGGVLWCGDGLEAAIASAPVAPTVARLGRGLENLEHASKTLSQGSSRKAWEELYRNLHK